MTRLLNVGMAAIALMAAPVAMACDCSAKDGKTCSEKCTEKGDDCHCKSCNCEKNSKTCNHDHAKKDK